MRRLLQLWFVALVACGMQFSSAKVLKRLGSSARLINGDLVKSWRQAPYMASLFVEEYGSDSLLCSGAFVDTDVVATAAHCVSNLDASAKVKVCAGTVLADPKSPGCREAADIRMPHGWSLFTHGDGYDLALIKLKSPMSSTIVKPISVSFDTIPSGTVADAIGFGDYTPYVEYDWKMRVVDTKIVTSSKCKVTKKISVDTSKFICADGNYDGSEGSACYGDSGGPLVIRGGKAEDDVLVGILSFGITVGGYCRTDMEAGFTKLSDPSHKQFLTDASQELGCSLSVVQGGSGESPGPDPKATDDPKKPVETSNPEPISSGDKASGYVDFAFGKKGSLCKTTKLRNGAAFRDLQLTQQHILSEEKDVRTVAWLGAVGADGEVEICVALVGTEEWDGVVRVWYTRTQGLFRICRRSMSKDECARRVKSKSLAFGAGRVCSRHFSPPMSRNWKRPSFDEVAVFTTANVASQPASSFLSVKPKSLKRIASVCVVSATPKEEDTRRRRVSTLVVNPGGPFSSERVRMVVKPDRISCQSVSDQSVPSSTSGIMVGLISKTVADSFGTWIRIRKGQVQVCIGAISDLAVKTPIVANVMRF
ncbi:hypothetical protein NDN08_001677 [Rhodosorus marinus]|uniref:Peptidase S1 domain-containing protein n=1 Tax=Rhodosorus marinus TaxID=101924 RepID=A0AAV8UVM1_9RHOD|nr:hypothetical protein NDN08_001677 [Rhodosorus marinus]